ncbi:unnamed protein product [marine sediment metagenome]|uniref:Uncharacterized protein n=1 Tax=marine sediment metagenome TaxID=412755 RepID=X1JWK0_9ZZZZ
MNQERRGAKLQITKKNGIQIAGELITVKPNSLLLLNTEGWDVSVGIADIKIIRVMKKSKVWRYRYDQERNRASSPQADRPQASSRSHPPHKV